MQAWSSSSMLKHGKQVLLVHHLPCRKHIYSSSEGDINLPHLWHRSHRKAFSGDRLCQPSAAAQLGPWGVQAEGLSEFFNGADNKMLAWKQPRRTWQQYLHSHETQAKGNSETDRTWCLLWSPATFSPQTWISQQAFKVFAGGQDPNPKRHWSLNPGHSLTTVAMKVQMEPSPKRCHYRSCESGGKNYSC